MYCFPFTPGLSANKVLATSFTIVGELDPNQALFAPRPVELFEEVNDAVSTESATRGPVLVSSEIRWQPTLGLIILAGLP